MLKGFESKFLENFEGWDDMGDLCWQVYEAKILPNVFPDWVDVNKLYCVFFDLNRGIIELFLDGEDGSSPHYSGSFIVKLV